jgi:hypothetical protein
VHNQDRSILGRIEPVGAHHRLEKLITIPERRGERQNTLDQLIRKLLPLLKEREMSGVHKRNLSGLRCFCCIPKPATGDRMGPACPQGKDRSAEVESESSQVKVRQLRKKQVQGQLLAAHETPAQG